MEVSEFQMHRRKWLGMAFGFSSFLIVSLLPFDLPKPQKHLIAVLILTFTFWVTEALPLPVTALLAMVLCSLLGILTPKQAFASLGNPIIFLFLGAFLLAEAVRTHELDRRWVEWVLSRNWIARTPLRILTGFGFAAWSLSGWMSNTATTATLYPLAWRTFQNLKGKMKHPENFGLALMLICAYASSIGGIITPVGTPPNLIALGFLERQAGIEIGFLEWMLVVAPVGIVMFACLIFMAWVSTRNVLYQSDGSFAFAPQRLGTPLTKGEINTLLAFGTAIGFWVLSGIAALLLEQKFLSDALERNFPFVNQALNFLKEMPEAVPALLGSVLLFVLPLEKGRMTMSWQQAQKIDWGTILLFAGGLTIGEAIFQTGLAKRISELITKLPFAETEIGLTIWGTTIAVWFTEIVSNTATANILTPIVLAAAKEANLSPVLPVLGTVIGCSFAFMLPIATPPNAIVYASGLVTIKQMVLWGLLLDIVSPFVIVLMLNLMSTLL
ncbi:MAG: SLC13 family permease [Armatimonadetes bacterium]|nr:SLC13 family permease [Armatimonadota bacterium]MDW8027727.1 SLC13 family permease [Armatimonadota bacterium]